uniref:CD59 glycoprotein-like n=1 Tax=Euleptes europaea TaxID=460621 RepID=UPI00253F9338|nr:CD59 glycoprotein-like [Euleptes europaea]
MDKTKCILITAFVTIVVFCHSGDALRCYTCEQSPVVCRTNVTCTPEEDVCLQIRFLNLRTYSCWKSSRCTRKEVADEFNADSFRFLCCYRDFCNGGPSFLAASTATFSISAVTVLWMVYQ